MNASELFLIYFLEKDSVTEVLTLRNNYGSLLTRR